MAKPQTELEKEIDVLTANWVSVSAMEQPMEYGAWAGWRQREMKSIIQPDAFTVPTAFPPTTVAGALSYFDVVRKIRKCNGWRSSTADLPKNPSAWFGEI